MPADDRTAGPRSLHKVINEVIETGAVAILVTLLEVSSSSSGESVGQKLLITDSGEKFGGLGSADLDDAVSDQAEKFLSSKMSTQMLKLDEFAPELAQFKGTTLLFERIEAEPRLVIAGAGHVGASLARLAAMIGYRVTLIDDRAEFLNRELFDSQIELTAATDLATSMRQSIGNGRAVFVAIVTRGHKQDEDCLRAVLAARPDYIGMIGSKRRTNIVLDKLREEGVYDELLRNVHAPIGLDIGAVSPEEVALAILAEIVSERRGGAGGSLSSWRRR